MEAAGGGLFADYFPFAEANEKKEASPEEELNAHLSLLRELSLDYPPRHWTMSIDGKDISGRYILWGAMNIRSAGPALHLAPKARTDDGRLDFVAVREHEGEILIKYVDAHLAGRKGRVPLAPQKFRKLKIMSPPGTMRTRTNFSRPARAYPSGRIGRARASARDISGRREYLA